MSKYTTTPWRTPSDLLAVRHQLYRLDPSPQDRRCHAVHRVMAWKLRGNLPHAVESTALLVDAFLHHDVPANSSFSVRAVYGAAFCRFVTGFCDIGRSRERSLEPSSMLEIARQIDMPAEFVALRHEATHEQLPGVQRLVGACEEALRWLWRVYWCRLDDQKIAAPTDFADGERRLDESRDHAGKMFKEHRTLKRRMLKSNGTGSLEETQHLRDAVDRFDSACGSERRAYEAVANDVVERKTLIPSDREMGSSLEGAFIMWDDLLQAMSKRSNDLLSYLVNALLLGVTNHLSITQNHQSEAHCEWLVHLGCSASWSKARQSSKVDVRSAMIRACIGFPNAWTSELGHKLLANADDEFEEQWRSIFEASLSVGDAKPGESEAPEVGPMRSTSFIELDAPRSEVLMGWHKAILPPSTPIGVIHRLA